MRRASVISVVVWLAACTAASGGVRDSGIDGRIVAGPTCPVERVPPSPQCAPRSLVASIRIHPAGKSSPRWTARSGADGRFKIRLRAGEYIFRPQPESGSQLPRPPSPTEVRVRPGRFTKIIVTYDTGIR